MVKVSFITVNKTSNEPLTLAKLANKYLSSKENSYFSQCKKLKRQQQFLCSRIAIKLLLIKNKYELKDYTLRFNENIKCLELLKGSVNQGYFISISHSQNMIAVIHSQQSADIGIDIERIKPNRPIKEIAKNYFHLDEQQRLSPEKFYQLWTTKEALAKASQLDLADILNQDTYALVKHNRLKHQFTTIGNYQAAWLFPDDSLQHKLQSYRLNTTKMQLEKVEI